MPGYEAGAETGASASPVPASPPGFPFDSQGLTRVQESGTCGKVPGLRPEGGIQCGGINRVVFTHHTPPPPVIFDSRIRK